MMPEDGIPSVEELKECTEIFKSGVYEGAEWAIGRHPKNHCIVGYQYSFEKKQYGQVFRLNELLELTDQDTVTYLTDILEIAIRRSVARQLGRGLETDWQADGAPG